MPKRVAAKRTSERQPVPVHNGWLSSDVESDGVEQRSSDCENKNDTPINKHQTNVSALSVHNRNASSSTKTFPHHGLSKSPAEQSPFKNSAAALLKSLITPAKDRKGKDLNWSPSLETPSPGIEKRTQTPGKVADCMRRKESEMFDSPPTWAKIPSAASSVRHIDTRDPLRRASTSWQELSSAAASPTTGLSKRRSKSTLDPTRGGQLDFTTHGLATDARSTRSSKQNSYTDSPTQIMKPAVKSDQRSARADRENVFSEYKTAIAIPKTITKPLRVRGRNDAEAQSHTKRRLLAARLPEKSAEGKRAKIDRIAATSISRIRERSLTPEIPRKPSFRKLYNSVAGSSTMPKRGNSTRSNIWTRLPHSARGDRTPSIRAEKRHKSGDFLQRSASNPPSPSRKVADRVTMQTILQASVRSDTISSIDSELDGNLVEEDIRSASLAHHLQMENENTQDSNSQELYFTTETVSTTARPMRQDTGTTCFGSSPLSDRNQMSEITDATVDEDNEPCVQCPPITKSDPFRHDIVTNPIPLHYSHTPVSLDDFTDAKGNIPTLSAKSPSPTQMSKSAMTSGDHAPYSPARSVIEDMSAISPPLLRTPPVYISPPKAHSDFSLHTAGGLSIDDGLNTIPFEDMPPFLRRLYEAKAAAEHDSDFSNHSSSSPSNAESLVRTHPEDSGEEGNQNIENEAADITYANDDFDWDLNMNKDDIADEDDCDESIGSQQLLVDVGREHRLEEYERMSSPLFEDDGPKNLLIQANVPGNPASHLLANTPESPGPSLLSTLADNNEIPRRVFVEVEQELEQQGEGRASRQERSYTPSRTSRKRGRSPSSNVYECAERPATNGISRHKPFSGDAISTTQGSGTSQINHDNTSELLNATNAKVMHNVVSLTQTTTCSGPVLENNSPSRPPSAEFAGEKESSLCSNAMDEESERRAPDAVHTTSPDPERVSRAGSFLHNASTGNNTSNSLLASTELASPSLEITSVTMPTVTSKRKGSPLSSSFFEFIHPPEPERALTECYLANSSVPSRHEDPVTDLPELFTGVGDIVNKHQDRSTGGLSPKNSGLNQASQLLSQRSKRRKCEAEAAPSQLSLDAYDEIDDAILDEVHMASQIYRQNSLEASKLQEGASCRITQFDDPFDSMDHEISASMVQALDRQLDMSGQSLETRPSQTERSIVQEPALFKTAGGKEVNIDMTKDRTIDPFDLNNYKPSIANFAPKGLEELKVGAMGLRYKRPNLPKSPNNRTPAIRSRSIKPSYRSNTRNHSSGNKHTGPLPLHEDVPPEIPTVTCTAGNRESTGSAEPTGLANASDTAEVPNFSRSDTAAGKTLLKPPDGDLRIPKAIIIQENDAAPSVPNISPEHQECLVPAKITNLEAGEFRRASGKSLPPVSTEAFSRAQTVMGISDAASVNSPDTLNALSTMRKTACFKAASGKELGTIFVDGMRKAESLFLTDDIGEHEVHGGKMSSVGLGEVTASPTMTSPSLFGGFGTASGKSLPPLSSASRRKAEVIMNSVGVKNLDSVSGQDTLTKHTPSAGTISLVAPQTASTPSVFSGFGTASGKSLPSLSNASVLKAKAIINSATATDTDLVSGQDVLPQQTPSVDSVQVAAGQTAAVPGVFGGFGTASGKSLPPLSSASLHRAQVIMNGAGATNSEPVRGQNVFVKEKSSARIPQVDAAQAASTPSVFSGFGTASGKSLPPLPRASLHKAQAIINSAATTNSDSEVFSEKKPSEGIPQLDAARAASIPGLFGGFDTASGKSLPPLSSASLHKAQAIMNGGATANSGSAKGHDVFPKEKTSLGIPQVDAAQTTSIPGVFSGFGTASGKSLPPLSKEAFKRAETIISSVATPNFECHGDVTGDGQSIEKNNARENIEGLGDLGGFQTASKRPLPQLSAKSLQVGAHLMDIREEFPKSENFQTGSSGFSRASGKALPTVSRESEVRASLIMHGSASESAEVSKLTGSSVSNASTEEVSGLNHSRFDSRTPQKTTQRVGLTGQSSFNGNTPSRLNTPFRENTEFNSLLNPGELRPSITNRPQPRTPMRTPAASSMAASWSKPYRKPSFHSPGGTGGASSGSKPMALSRTPTPVKRVATGFNCKPFVSPMKKTTGSPVGTPIAHRSLVSSLVNKNNGLMGPRKLELLKLFDLDTRSEQRLALNSLPARFAQSWQELIAAGVPSAALMMNICTARDFKFPAKSGDHPEWGLTQARVALLGAGADGGLASAEWVENHYSLILWKLASMVRSFPTLLDEYWSPTKVANQLRYRYEREINRAKRSAIKLIVEQDNSPSRFMVLCVSRRAIDDTRPTKNGVKTPPEWHLELTDGWYTIKASVDSILERQIMESRIYVGMKLSICAARLLGPSEPCPVLEASDEVQLGLHANGTRRSAWDTKLGYQIGKEFQYGIRHVSPDGGVIPCLDLVICRKYPLRYFEKLADGKTLFLSAGEESHAAREWERRVMREKERIIELKAAQTSLDRVQFNPAQIKKLESKDLDTQDLDEMVEDLGEPLMPYILSSNLCPERKERALGRLQQVVDKRTSELESEIKDQLDEVTPSRNVTGLVTFRVCDYQPKAIPKERCGLATLTIWGPNESQLSQLTEGKRFKVYRLLPGKRNASWSKVIELRAQRSTQYIERSTTPTRLASTLYQPRPVLGSIQCADLGELKRYEEVDLMIIILDHRMPVGDGRNEDVFVLAIDPSLTRITIQIPRHQADSLKLSTLPKFETVLFRNLEYLFYDRHFKIHKLKAGHNIDMRTRAYSTEEKERKAFVHNWALA
ncbi:hypothetical protein DFS34DRAFT_653041 [Phlyctochytrium arcticum]|nr:hypothetical protein DFS34DRAFT_653041 [Phlyctochytrium arcticum]